MTEQQYMIDLDGEGRAIVEPEDAAWLDSKLRQQSGPARFDLRTGEADTEGHAFAGTRVRVVVLDEDDTEGHAIALHFPSRQEADAFRRRLLITGAVVGTVTLGAIGGAALSNLPADQAGTVGSATVATQAGPMDAHEAPAFGSLSSADQAYADRMTAQAEAQARARAADAYSDRLTAQAAAQAGPMDAHEAPAFEAGAAAGATDVDRDLGIMDRSVAPASSGLSDADQAYADRLSGQAKAGPMDAHEAAAFQSSSAAATDADRDVGIMDGSNAAAASQAGSTDEEPESLGGPTPR